MNNLCEHCKFWQEWETQPDPRMLIGDCRKNAPINYSTGTKFMTKWPSTKGTDFCGQFKSRHEAKAA